MTVRIAQIYAYNARRYSWPWACQMVDGRNEFIRGAYGGNDNGGYVYIDDPVQGQVYGVGQRDNRGNNGATIYMVWTGAAFELCDRRGNAVDDDQYGEMIRRSNVTPILEDQAE